jgi:hypothetical protein
MLCSSPSSIEQRDLGIVPFRVPARSIKALIEVIIVPIVQATVLV